MSTKKLTQLAAEAYPAGTYEQWTATGTGWTDKLMIEHGYLTVVQNGAEIESAPDLILTAQQKEVFAGCVYVQDLHAIIVPGEADALDQKRFDVRFSGVYVLDVEGKKTTDSAWEIFTASRILKFPRVAATYFDPRDRTGQIRTDEQGRRAINTYVPLNLERKGGEASPFINHLRKILPNGNDAGILIAYLARMRAVPRRQGGVGAAFAGWRRQR